MVGTSDDRSTNRSIPCSTLAPASLATARARSLVATDMAGEATFRRPPIPSVVRPAAGAGAALPHLPVDFVAFYTL